MAVAVHDAASLGAEQPGVPDVLVQTGINQFRGSRTADTGIPYETVPSINDETRETWPTDEYSAGLSLLLYKQTWMVLDYMQGRAEMHSFTLPATRRAFVSHPN